MAYPTYQQGLLGTRRQTNPYLGLGGAQGNVQLGMVPFGQSATPNFGPAQSNFPGTTNQAPVGQNPQAQSGGGGPPMPSTGQLYDYSNDPILQKILALNKESRASAESSTDANVRELLLGFGSQQLARQTLGENDPIIPNISADPDRSLTTLAQIARAARERERETTAWANSPGVNVGFSGTRLRMMNDLTYQRQAEESDATNLARSRISEQRNNLLNFINELRAREIEAQESAYQRALAFAMQNASSEGEPEVGNAAPPPSGGSTYNAGTPTIMGNPIPTGWFKPKTTYVDPSVSRQRLGLF